MTNKKKVAVFPGSFNPFHKGHLSVLEQAEMIFDEVIIAIGKNPEKTENYSNPDTIGDVAIGKVSIDRVETIKREFPDKKIEQYTGFLTDYIEQKENEDFDITIVRGLRNGNDLDYETTQLKFMRDMKPDIKVVFISCDEQYKHISSSAIRILENIQEGSGHHYLAKNKKTNG